MGLEKEKADTKIFMDEDDFHRSGSPALSESEKNSEKAPDRDPRGLNTHLKLGFEDVIAEPASTHSFDRIWICSHALFELSKYLVYKVLTLVLAVPLALVAGLLFALLSCLHIWFVVPFIKSCLMVLPSIQAVWKSMTDLLVAPVCRSIGKCFSGIKIRLDQE
ncbi:caveolin-2 [Anolis carolinensis]|uniref:Caveolin n=1 Tax=Anolis carolinensis TaxID=28377 RepID=A0A803SS16_ANOCA|nr:PREDICTED: caveolin-2 [Anolis carolinensis]|eukprot:XP_003221260.1 PREDICTED: caveolin-2 [Anolis carolinensis]